MCAKPQKLTFRQMPKPQDPYELLKVVTGVRLGVSLDYGASACLSFGILGVVAPEITTCFQAQPLALVGSSWNNYSYEQRDLHVRPGEPRPEAA